MSVPPNNDNHKTSRDYELLVYKMIEQELSGISGVEVIEITHNAKIKGLSGYIHQIDVAYRFRIWKTEILVLVECKQYRESVGIDELLEFRARIEDIKANKGVFVTSSNFQKGAIQFAQANRIALLVIRGVTPVEELDSTDIFADLEYIAPYKQCQMLLEKINSIYDIMGIDYRPQITLDYKQNMVKIRYGYVEITLEPNELDFFLSGNTVRRTNFIDDLFFSSEEGISTWCSDKLLKAIIIDELLTPQNTAE
jgi:hypothetical protein